ncbi:carbohydrate-binding protein [Streptomyces mobaraensis]|uniref:carbohydrate-binding protein n=1 Tax=Streptomyces mobaraensis TaxID=35621 RepID=UPI0033346604
MTAGNNGNGKPEDEDPFGYLYRSEGGDQGTDAAASAPQPGVPRTSYNQVRPVGSRQYTPQQGGGTYGAGMPAPQQPTPHYAAPETLPGGAPRHPGPPPGAPGPQRPKRRGLLIAAIAVVVVVAGGIGAAVYANQGDGDDKKTTAQQTPSEKPSEKPEKKDQKDDEKKPSGKPVKDMNRDAATLQLGGGASTAKDVKGAPTEGGVYVTMKQGSSIEWKDVPVTDAGKYTVWVDYGAQNGAASGSLWVNGEKLSTTVNWKKWPGDGWSHTFNYVQLEGGKNDIKLQCESQCNINIARVKILPGWYKS